MLSYDSWLSSLLNKPALQLNGAPLSLRSADLPREPALVYAKVAADRTVDLLHLQSLQFRLVDTNVQLTRSSDWTAKTANSRPAINVRFATPDDEAAIRSVARSSFEYDRFHSDPAIDESIASRIKEEWAANFFVGKRGRWMVVAESDGVVCGFLQVLAGRGEEIVIDLIAVAKQSRGKGVANAMIANASVSCVGRMAPMQVGTQLANAPSLALYQKIGFRIVSATYVLHLHTSGS